MAHYPADTFQEATEIAIEASNQLHGVINGDANAEVTVEDGSKIPSVRKAMVDSLYFKPPIAWEQGEYEDTYNQLREFIDGDVRTWWFAKGATVSTPVLMSTSPATDINWTLWSAVTLNAATYETQKRLAAEAGLNMVGSFLLGASVTTTDDVVFYETDGKYYGWGGTLPKVVPAGSTPATSGGVGALLWVDRTDLMLRSDLESGGSSIDEISNIVDVSEFSSLKQIAAASGFNLVTGSFEKGATTTNPNDVVRYRSNNKYYRRNDGASVTVTAGSAPDANWTVMDLEAANPVSVLNLPVAGSPVSGAQYNVNGQIVAADDTGYGFKLNAVSLIMTHLSLIAASHTREYARWSDQAVYSDNFTNLTGWTGSSGTVLQVSGNKVYSNRQTTLAGMSHAISCGTTGLFRVCTQIAVIDLGGSYSGGTFVGINSGTAGSAPAAGLTDSFGVYFSYNAVRIMTDGVLTAVDNATTPKAGIYNVTIVGDATYTSIVARHTDGSIGYEYSIRLGRTAKACNNVVIFNSDARLLSGNYIYTMAIGVGSNATVNSLYEGLFPSVVWSGDGTNNYRIVSPVGYDSRKTKPAVILFHGNGSNEKTWATNTNYYAISKALVDAGFIVLSASYGASGSTWGNTYAQAAYYAAYRYLLLNYNISSVSVVANSMGGVEFFNTVSTGNLGVPCSFVGTSTTANLAACYASPTLTSSIQGAYGIAVDGSDYATKTAGYDPILKRPDLFLGIPQLWLCASDDTIVPPTTNRDLMVKLARISTSKISQVDGITGGHSFDITPYTSTIVNFIRNNAA